MKPHLLIVAAFLLCSCAEYGPPMRTSVGFNGQSMQTMDLTDPNFYMNDDATPLGGGTSVPSTPRLGIDGFCSSSCQRRGSSPGY